MKSIRKMLALLLALSLCISVIPFAAANEGEVGDAEDVQMVENVPVAPEEGAEAEPSEEAPEAEENKAEENKAEENKAEENKAEENKAEENKAEENKAEENKAEENKVEENKAEENKAEENKAEENKAEENKAEENKAEENKAEENKVEETKAEENKVEETKAEENKVEETKVEETKAEENKVEETKVEENKAEETKVEVTQTETVVTAEPEVAEPVEEDPEPVMDLEEKEEEEHQAVAPVDITLDLNGTVNLYLEGDYVQKAKIVLTQPGYLNVLTTFLESTSDEASLSIRVVNETMTTTYWSSTVRKVDHISELGEWFDPGTYYVLYAIIRDNGGQVWPISYRVQTTFTPETVTAGNGDISSAASLPLDNIYHEALLARTSNECWWKITLTQAGRLEVGVRSHVPNVEAYVVDLRNGQRSRRYINMSVFGGTTDKAAFNTAEDWFEAGEYYLCVNARDKRTGKYSAMATFTAANNQESTSDGSWLTANTLTPNGTMIRGLLSVTDEIDMFTFRINDTYNMELNVNAFMNALTVELFNGTTRVLLDDLSDWGTDGTKERPHIHRDIIRLDPGDYTVMVARDPEGPRGIYTIKVQPTITVKSVNLNALVINAGQTISGNVTITGSTAAKYYYHLQRLNADGAWVNYSYQESAANTFAFANVPAGVYRVLAQSSDGAITAEYTSEEVTVRAGTGILIHALDISPDVVTVGEPIVLTPVIECADQVKRVIYSIYDMDDNLLTAFETAGATAGKWTPTKGGVFKVTATATDNGAQWASVWADDLLIVLDAPTLTVTEVEALKVPPFVKNSPVTFKVHVEDGKPTTYIYEVYYFGNFFQRFTSNSDEFTYRFNASGDWKVMAVVTDGTNWSSGWSDEFQVMDTVGLGVSITASGTEIPTGGKVNFKLKYSGTKDVVFTEYQLLNKDTNTLVDKWSGNSNNHTFGFATPGTYCVMAVVSDGTNWASEWSETITVGAPPAITLTSMTANKPTAAKPTIYAGEFVTYDLYYSTGDPILFIYNIYKNGVLIDAVTTESEEFKYQYKDSGNYKIMAVATDGFNWASIWGPSITVTAPTKLQILKLDVVGGPNKTFYEEFTVAPEIRGDKDIVSIYYEIYDSFGTKVAQRSGKFGSITFKPPVKTVRPTYYNVQVVVTDGSAWVSSMVPVYYTDPDPLTVSSVADNIVPDMFGNKVIELGQSVEFYGYVEDGAKLMQTQFHVMYDDGMGGGFRTIERVDGNSQGYTFIPNQKGDYQVMFVAYDGITWASKFSEVITVE